MIGLKILKYLLTRKRVYSSTMIKMKVDLTQSGDETGRIVIKC